MKSDDMFSSRYDNNYIGSPIVYRLRESEKKNKSRIGVVTNPSICVLKQNIVHENFGLRLR